MLEREVCWDMQREQI